MVNLAIILFYELFFCSEKELLACKMQGKDGVLDDQESEGKLYRSSVPKVTFQKVTFFAVLSWLIHSLYTMLFYQSPVVAGFSTVFYLC